MLPQWMKDAVDTGLRKAETPQETNSRLFLNLMTTYENMGLRTAADCLELFYRQTLADAAPPTMENLRILYFRMINYFNNK